MNHLRNFNPRPPHGGRPAIGFTGTHFNPRPPHGGRHPETLPAIHHSVFQPAPPARRATNGDHNFNPRPPHGGPWGAPDLEYFNPRPPHGGRLLRSVRIAMIWP